MQDKTYLLYNIERMMVDESSNAEEAYIWKMLSEDVMEECVPCSPPSVIQVLTNMAWLY